MSCFADSLTVKLGDLYIAKTLEWFLVDNNKFLYHVITSDNKIVGYCGGFVSKHIGDGSTSGMMKYAMKEAFLGILKKPYLLFHKEVIAFYPLIFKNIFQKYFYHDKNISSDKITAVENKLGLVVIGVHPNFRGKGIFEMLMNTFENEAASRNISKLSLSVRSNNARAIAAYKKNGWQINKQTSAAVNMYKVIALQNA